MEKQFDINIFYERYNGMSISERKVYTSMPSSPLTIAMKASPIFCLTGMCFQIYQIYYYK